MDKNRLSVLSQLESFLPWRCRFEACFMACNKFTSAVIFLSKLLCENSPYVPYETLLNTLFIKIKLYAEMHSWFS